MKVRILQLLGGAKQATGVAVIIDVFRAFTVEAYLSDNGAERIYPVGDLDFVRQYKKEHPETVLIGERGGRIIDGFDYGNSPSAIKNIDFRGKKVMHTTSAGTQGIANAKNADVILTGSLVNAKAIAAYIRQSGFADVSLVCMGLAADKETEEDTLCAEYIKALLEDRPFDFSGKIDLLKQTSGAKFFDPALRDVFPTEDFYLSCEIDRFNFVLRIERDDNGLIYARRIQL